MPRPKPIPPPPPKPRKVAAGNRFSPEIYDRIRAEAARRRVSINTMVEWIAEDWLNGRSIRVRGGVRSK